MNELPVRNRQFFLNQYEREPEWYGSDAQKNGNGEQHFGNPDYWSVIPGYLPGHILLQLDLRTTEKLPDLVAYFLQQAETLRDFVEEKHLLTTEAALINNSIAQASYWYSAALLDVFRSSQNRRVDAWKYAADALLRYYNGCKKHSDSERFTLLEGSLYLIAGGFFKEANDLLTYMGKPRKSGVHAYKAQQLLAAELLKNGWPIQNKKVIKEVLGYFNLVARADNPREPESISFSRQFIWALLICAYIHPGDGKWEVDRAIQLFADGCFKDGSLVDTPEKE